MRAVTTGCCSRGIEPDRGDGPEAGLAAGFEGLDDDHPPAAARASIPVFVVATIFGVIARPARQSRVGYGEEPAGQCNVVGPVGIREEAVVTDAMKSVGQDVDQALERMNADTASPVSLSELRTYRGLVASSFCAASPARWERRHTPI